MTLQNFNVLKHVENPCHCPTPSDEVIVREMFAVGTLIECKKCKAQFKLDQSQKDGWCWMRQNVGPRDEDD